MAKALRLVVKTVDGKTCLIRKSDDQVVHTVTTRAEEELLRKLALLSQENNGKVMIKARPRAYGFQW